MTHFFPTRRTSDLKGEALAVELERALESSPPQEQAANGTIDTASDFSSEHRGGIMPVSSTPAVERVARVLSGLKLSQNAEGADPHASDAVDMEWQDEIENALAVLRRSEEHTSELPSLLRISYAVFCLKKPQQ